MQNIQKTRFVAANYSNLQGLKGVPVGILLLVVVYWANTVNSKGADLTLPILLSLLAGGLVLAIKRYYDARYGKTERTPAQKRFELVLGVAGGALGLGAFIADGAFDLPFSLIGLVFALSVVVEYVRMQWYAPGRYLLPGTVFYFVILLVVSILPLMGVDDWWLLLGLRNQMLGVLAAAGVITVISGLVGHWFFVRTLPQTEE